MTDYILGPARCMACRALVYCLRRLDWCDMGRTWVRHRCDA